MGTHTRCVIGLVGMLLLAGGCQQEAGWAVVNRGDKAIGSVEVRSQKSGYEPFVVEVSKLEPGAWVAGPSAGELMAERTTVRWSEGGAAREQTVETPVMRLSTSFDGYGIIEYVGGTWKFVTQERAKAKAYLGDGK
ncbi:MAG TPA: hypothetical protein VK986_23890 [Tepidisphaeraceae bacterium]|nr:hypothetical protein [Tepidisphaeraceae bacterium]